MKTKTRNKVFYSFPIHWNTCAALYNKTFRVFKVLVCGGGESENSIRFLSFQRVACPDKSNVTRHATQYSDTPPGTRNKGSYNCL